MFITILTTSITESGARAIPTTNISVGLTEVLKNDVQTLRNLVQDTWDNYTIERFNNSRHFMNHQTHPDLVQHTEAFTRNLSVTKHFAEYFSDLISYTAGMKCVNDTEELLSLPNNFMDACRDIIRAIIHVKHSIHNYLQYNGEGSLLTNITGGEFNCSGLSDSVSDVNRIDQNAIILDNFSLFMSVMYNDVIKLHACTDKPEAYAVCQSV
ncbi:uncharacterized protein LOC117115427 [Anneissia japonica]|uniref:uncharacterized protein LOC117115427 n=1 Tax=Anneissia japonica TaxID=1529436 RepID=UPI001425AEC8|nr:uncharacterized protein LOC117115427 [Anneissia japonica]